MPEPTYTSNSDGSVTVTVEDKTTRFVKESDLLAVKGSSETEKTRFEGVVSDLQTKLADSTRLHNEVRASLVTEQASKETLDSKLQEATAAVGKVGELQDKLTAAEGREQDVTALLLGRVKTDLLQRGIPEEKLKDSDLTALRSIEDALNLVPGKQPADKKPANYIPDGGGGGPLDKKTAVEQASEELALARKQQAEKAAGLIKDPDMVP
ncbi:hypothetical protein LCGC14_0316240 [marine sediment metagenome]|uniref:Scaffolding protein n=1 Tax=marine sediment metagenome TaxID=412755 RepID=A0A0F9U324_9ZZZZ